MKHNAGPWSVYPVFTDDHLYGLWDPDGNGLNPSDEETRRANARLMSAAPDMLAALIEAHDMLCRYYQRNDKYRKVVVMASTAIAKATEEK